MLNISAPGSFPGLCDSTLDAEITPPPLIQVGLLQGQADLIQSALKTRIANYNAALEVYCCIRLDPICLWFKCSHVGDRQRQ